MRVQFVSLNGSHNLTIPEGTTISELENYVVIPDENLEFRVRGVEVDSGYNIQDGDMVVATKKAKAGL